MKKKITNSPHTTALYTIARGMRACLGEIRRNLRSGKKDGKVITFKPEGTSRGRVLFSYIIDGFLLKTGESVPTRHTNIWQSVNMAEAFLEMGCEVDVISWKNESFLPTGDYSACVDVRWNLERLAPVLNRDCVTIAHLDTSHILFHNAAEARRLLELQERRGITLQPRRFETPNLLIEHADYATTGGNDAVVRTFEYAGKKIYKLPSPCATMYDWEDNKDWETCRRHFLWFSSSGMVHKGLDLVLDAFTELPDCHLTICAPVEKDADFVRAYHKELFESSNIETIGWVDIESKEFRKITGNNIAVLHASCSEGGAPAVKTCMHAGLIPVVSYETAVDVGGFGLTLGNCSVEEIRDSVSQIATLSPGELEARSRRAWEFARQHHTRENFAREYRSVVSKIMSPK